MPRTLRRRPSREAGLTLVELVIATVVIAIAVTGTLLAMNLVTRHSADPVIDQQAAAIAEAYLEEILPKSFLDPTTNTVCPPPESSRPLYDNVCDYNGLVDAGARDQDGNAVAGLSGYRVSVVVDTAASLNGLTGSNNVLRVDVTVTHAPDVSVTLSGYRTDY